jgi:anti-sigma B factor antagonist
MGPSAVVEGPYVRLVSDRVREPVERTDVLFDLQRRERDGWSVLAVLGELDLAAAPRVRHAVMELVRGAFPPPTTPPRVIVDLSGVDFLDSAGLGVVLGAVRRVRLAGGTAAIVVGTPQVRGVFEVLGLDRVLQLARSVDEVVRAGEGDRPAPGSSPDLPVAPTRGSVDDA